MYTTNAKTLPVNGRKYRFKDNPKFRQFYYQEQFPWVSNDLFLNIYYPVLRPHTNETIFRAVPLLVLIVELCCILKNFLLGKITTRFSFQL